MPPLILTLEIGTSSVRASVYDAKGRSVPGLADPSPTRPRMTADGGFVLDADELVRQALTCLERVLTACGQSHRARLAGIALTTFWHSTVAVDARGKAASPLLMWPDTRSESDAQRLGRQLDARALHRRTGAPLHSSFLPAKFLWLRRTLPATFHKARAWMSIGEYLCLRWFGRPSCSHSMASATGLFNLALQDWDEEILDHLRLRRDQFTPIQDASRPVERERDRLPASLRALRGLPWYPALGDGACSNVGCGCLSPDRLALMIGTSGALRMVTDPAQLCTPAISTGLFCYLIDTRRTVVGGSLSNAGNLRAWMLAALRLPPGRESDRRAAALPPAGHGLVILPFLHGERAPFWRGDLRAVVAGLRAATRPEEIYRAALESVAFGFARIHDLLQPMAARNHLVVATGGGVTESRLLPRILADVLGMPVRLCLEKQASSRGAALMALESLGVLDNLGRVPARTGALFTPDASARRSYRAAQTRQDMLLRKLGISMTPTA
ncbi:MAG: gluconokinase [Planctomycetes bacterium]|nr:gluconokinase [Planctomycetota bacterium]